MFLKKVYLFMLYPDSKMIGGSSSTKKIELKSCDKFVMYTVTPNLVKSAPASNPKITVKPAS